MEKSDQIEKLVQLLDETIKHTTFNAGKYGCISPDDLRQRYHRPDGQAELSITPTDIEVPDNVFELLMNVFRPLIQPYINTNTNKIGNIASLIPSSTSVSRPEHFVKILIQAAVLLGSKHSAEIFLGWVEGKVLPYKHKVLLWGVDADSPLKLIASGLELRALKDITPDIDDDLLAEMIGSYSKHPESMGGAVLIIDCEASPVLYKPIRDTGFEEGKHTWAHGSTSDDFEDELCDALSLACNGYVRWKTSWSSRGSLRAFKSLGVSAYRFSDTPIPTYHRIKLTQEELMDAVDIYQMRHNYHTKRRSIDIAIHRWVKSIQPRLRFADQCIELRIALEALFLGSDGRGVGYRLATNAAWYLGNNSKERQEYFGLFHKIYKLASQVIHARHSETTVREDEELLKAAQNVCREGILKRLKEKEEPNWDDLILGADDK
ncbi:MAG: hypothetical protein ACR2PR_01640 [Pseudohongiellaceae bacterium]